MPSAYFPRCPVFPLTCRTCGDWFTARRSTAQVCRRCRNRREADRIRETRARTGFRSPEPEPQPRDCLGCGARFLAKRRTRYCSQGCYPKPYQNYWSKELVGPVAVPPKPRPTPPFPTYRPRVWVAGSCRRCGSAFVVVDQLTASYCSRTCARSDAKVRRRAAERQAHVENVYRARIFARDGYRCQLCKKPLDMDAVVPAPRAPTIDHIVPLAWGGSHEPSNCQAACFMCNSRKGARSEWVQPRLVAS